MVSAHPADRTGAGPRASLGSRLRKDFRLYGGAYLLMVPVVLFYILFCYKPMYGLMIAFKDFSPAAGILGSDWAASYGFQNFIDFFGSYYFWRLLKNTLTISLATLVFGFPAPILLALLFLFLRPNTTVAAAVIFPPPRPKGAVRRAAPKAAPAALRRRTRRPASMAQGRRTSPAALSRAEI